LFPRAPTTWPATTLLIVPTSAAATFLLTVAATATALRLRQHRTTTQQRISRQPHGRNHAQPRHHEHATPPIEAKTKPNCVTLGRNVRHQHH